MKVVVIASLAYSLVNFRGALLRRMVEEGHRVVACAPDRDAAVERALAEMGVLFRQVPMDRTGLNPWRDVATLSTMISLIRTERPDIVLAYTQKPIIYGGIATRLAGGRARFFAMVSGLGHVYGEENGVRRGAIRRLVSFLYSVAVARAAGIFVFNGDDAEEMLRHRIVTPDHAIMQVPGSGVDIARFMPAPVPDGPPTFLLVARLMREKGLAEFVTAARLVRARHPDARFRILGPMDSNPTGVGKAELDAWLATGDVEYLGETRDVIPFLTDCHVFVLPSYYREGLPRSILEAMASGRAIVTTDMPGCREPVEEGGNGFLVPPRDAEALATALTRFIEEPGLAARMGTRSRRLAEECYDVKLVNEGLIQAMGLSRGTRRPRRHSRALGDRRLLEVALALMMMTILLPVLALVALVVLVDVGHPVLFAQRRSGAGGRPFRLVKFRTMREAVDRFGRPLPDEQRMTAVGRVLRRTRLDELPELWNIIRGDMSIVGPRPLLPETLAAMPGAADRGAVRPGLTGWAQVNGNALLRDSDKMALDLWYVRNRSLWLDWRIVLATVTVVAGGEHINLRSIEDAHAGLADRRG